MLSIGNGKNFKCDHFNCRPHICMCLVHLSGFELFPQTGNDLKMSDVDGLPYSTILYGSGPGHGTRNTDGENSEEVEPPPLSMVPDMNTVHAAAAPRQWATHGAEDVPVYAMGE